MTDEKKLEDETDALIEKLQQEREEQARDDFIAEMERLDAADRGGG